MATAVATPPGSITTPQLAKLQLEDGHRGSIEDELPSSTLTTPLSAGTPRDKKLQLFQKSFKYASKTEDLLIAKSCKYETTIGHLFVTSTTIHFYGKIFKKKIKFSINLADVRAIEKKKFGLLANAIRISTAHAKLLFRDFHHRDLMYETLVAAWKTAAPNAGTDLDSFNEEGNVDFPIVSLEDDFLLIRSVPSVTVSQDDDESSDTDESMLGSPVDSTMKLLTSSSAIEPGSSTKKRPSLPESPSSIIDLAQPHSATLPRRSGHQRQRSRSLSITGADVERMANMLDLTTPTLSPVPAKAKRRSLAASLLVEENRRSSEPIMLSSDHTLSTSPDRGNTTALQKVAPRGSEEREKEDKRRATSPLPLSSTVLLKRDKDKEKEKDKDSKEKDKAKEKSSDKDKDKEKESEKEKEKEKEKEQFGTAAEVSIVEAKIEREGQIVLEHVFNAPFEALCSALFGDDAEPFKRYHQRRKTTNMQMQKWTSKGTDGERELVYIIPAKIPMSSRTHTTCYEQQKIVRRDSTVMIVQTTTKTPEVPFGDCFVTVNNFYVTAVSSTCTRVAVTAIVKFLKSTIFKGKIEKTAYDNMPPVFAELVVELNATFGQTAGTAVPTTAEPEKTMIPSPSLAPSQQAPVSSTPASNPSEPETLLSKASSLTSKELAIMAGVALLLVLTGFLLAYMIFGGSSRATSSPEYRALQQLARLREIDPTGNLLLDMGRLHAKQDRNVFSDELAILRDRLATVEKILQQIQNSSKNPD